MIQLPHNVNFLGHEWANYETYLKERREKLRTQLAQLETTPESTWVLRGQLLEIERSLGFKPLHLERSKDPTL